MAENNFEKWNKQKQKIHNYGKRIHFKKGEIRWVHMGENIRSEIKGKGAGFSRPIIILKKLFGHSCLAILLTSQVKIGSYYCSFNGATGKKYYAALHQIKYIDGTRIREKIDYVIQSEFEYIEKTFIKFIKK